MKVLIIEENQQIRESLTHLLELACLEVVSTFNGLQGLFLIKDQHPDLILCNTDLPVVNGYNVLTTLRKASIMIPFVLMSAWSDVEEVTYALMLGANEYITQPFQTQQIMAVVQRYINGHHASAGI